MITGKRDAQFQRQRQRQRRQQRQRDIDNDIYDGGKYGCDIDNGAGSSNGSGGDIIATVVSCARKVIFLISNNMSIHSM